MGIEDLLLDESFIRHVLGKSPTDLDRWTRYVNEHPETAGLVSQAREIITFISSRHTRPTHPEISEQVFNRLQQQILTEQQVRIKRRKVSLRIYWYAASLIFLTGISLLFLINKRPVTTISKNNFLEIIVPEGQRSQLVLPDGSKVWLNAGTNFKYPSGFMIGSREVYMTGEAFFDITHDKNDTPFTVYLNEGLQINVLGTEFNVKCYETDKVIETTLVKGSIQMIRKEANIIQKYSLKPNEKAVYRKENRELSISALAAETESEEDPAKPVVATKEEKLLNEIDAVTAWKNEELVFSDETFEDIAIRMERWFGIKITVKDEALLREHFTGKFVNNESIYQILDIFNRSESIQYTTRNKEIIIMKRK